MPAYPERRYGYKLNRQAYLVTRHELCGYKLLDMDDKKNERTEVRELLVVIDNAINANIAESRTHTIGPITSFVRANQKYKE